MKNITKILIGIVAICSIVILSSSKSSSQGIRWPFGAANTITVTVNDTIEIGSDVLPGYNYIDLNTDTNIVLNVTSPASSLSLGDYLLIEATESGIDADTITYGTNITGLADPLPSGKTKIISFYWNGSAWQKIAVTQID